MSARVGSINCTAKMSWQQCLDYFLLFKSSQGLSPRTLQDYRYHVALFFRETNASLSDQGNLRLAVMQYFSNSFSLLPSTFNTRRKSLKPFFAWAVSEGFLPGNPLDGIKKRKEDLKPRSVDEETIRRLLALPDQRTFSGVRDYALLLLTMDTGIRPSEAFGLKVQDFNPRSLEIAIPASVAKTRVSRTLPLSSVTAEAIKRLIMARHPAWAENGILFCTDTGSSLNKTTWGRRLAKYSAKLGVKVYPYALRHTFAIMFLRLGGNAFALQRTLGHADLTMTKRYVALTNADLSEQHALASPLRVLAPQKKRIRKLT